MSTWRQKAIALFPDNRWWFQQKEATPYWVFFDLLPLVIEYHQIGNIEGLRRIYSYAAWCYEQKERAPQLWNAAATAFYEHLVDHDITLCAIPEWVPPEIFVAMQDEWYKRLERKEPGRFQGLVEHYNHRHPHNADDPNAS
jgi:hypothetical protein